MTAVEIVLLVIGVVFFIASFFITEKLGPGELSKIGELSNDEIEKVMERELQKVSGEIEGRVEEKVEHVLEKSERSIEKECNEKIMAISEYADTVVESMNKTHNEIMFLYSMLNDKHAELTQFSSKLQELASELQKKDQEIESHLRQRTMVEEVRYEQVVAKEEPVLSTETDKAPVVSEKSLDEIEDVNHNAEILSMYREGKSSIEIARALSLGLGEVQLVIGLYEGKRK